MSQLPQQIGQFQVRRLIASGGMGSVYEGQQQNPRRSVAIKVISASVDSEEAAGRLRYEAQLLARLRHPGIAEIYEAGTYTQDGKQLPYFAMEYIPNARSITGYANEKNLSLRDRLELFAEACDAVHHGHQRSIVHRDLKPANILVDSNGRVRVIDFGIARATDADLKQTSIQTEVGQLVGSAAYMSPEQFEADPRDIDTRSDVYALGVVLYELLAGVMPYDAQSKSIYEVALLIKDEQPPPLRTKNPQCKGELEVIVDKALRKDRSQRYESTHGLAADIRRYLAGEAIAAKPQSMKYQLQVFTRRNKALVGMAVAVLVLLVAGISITSWLYVSVRQERERTAAQAESAARARDFLTEAMRSFAPPGFDPLPGVGEICDRTAAELEGKFDDSPETEADVRMSLAKAYARLRRLPEAELHYQRAIELRKSVLGSQHASTRQALKDLRRFYFVHAMGSQLVKVARELAEIEEQRTGPESEETFWARRYVVDAVEVDQGASVALTYARELLDYCTASRGPADELTLRAEQVCTNLLMQAGRTEESLTMARHNVSVVEANFPSDHDLHDDARKVLAASLLASGETGQPKVMYGNKRLPDHVDVEHAFQGDYTPHDSDITILVFWETWCPFSQRAVPKLDEVYRQYQGMGIDVVGITRVNRSATEQSVYDFIAEKKLTMPVVKETGRMWNYFECTGTPFVCVTHNDELVWKGSVSSAEEFSQRIIEGMLNTP